jgi:16S rRNA A1518/A1519 N6-dimethyltransferase RsmA/KsgA/DIM1 with predicted DNA glycosylase/AP lyase activity
VVTLTPRPGPHPDPDAFGRFLQGLFQGRRKAIRTTLRARSGRTDAAIDAVLAAAGLEGTARVDALEPETLARLFAVVTSGMP